MKTNQATKDYRQIVFLQGDEATEALSNLDLRGIESTVNMLLDYDLCPESCRHTVFSPTGESDTSYLTTAGYELTWNSKLGYIGLCEVTEIT